MSPVEMMIVEAGLNDLGTKLWAMPEHIWRESEALLKEEDFNGYVDSEAIYTTNETIEK